MPKDLEQLTGDLSPPSARESSPLQRLATLQLRQPFVVLLVALVMTAISIALATQLEIKTGFENLIPEDRPSVVELRRVAEHTTGVSMMFVVLYVPPEIDPPPTAELRKAADDLTIEIEKVGAPWVGSVESGVHEAVDFLGPRAGLYADKDKLRKLRDDIEARYTYEVEQKAGFDLDLEEDDAANAPPEIDADKIRADFGVDQTQQDRFPDGYYQSEDGRTVIVAVRSKVLGSDFEDGSEAIKRVKDVVERYDPTTVHPAIQVGFAGDLVTSIGEYTAINDDLTDVGYLGAFFITAVVLLFYLRLRTLFTMLLTISIGVSLTFGVTELTIGNLNMATGFLFTIVAGNGINPGIIYMARYLEARRNGASLEEAIRISHRETWLPTLTASAAAAAAYGSLLVTEFRGFRDFGLIGGLGMVLCWIATFWTMPSILTVLERFFPIANRKTDRSSTLGRLSHIAQNGIAYGKPFAAIIQRIPRTLMVTGLGLALVGSVLMVMYIRADPMEYNLQNLRTDQTARAQEIRMTELADGITGHVGSDGMAILTDDPKQVKPLQVELRKVRDAAPEAEKPFNDVHALQDFVPDDQAEKIPLLIDIKKYVLKAHQRGLIKDKDWEKLQAFIPPDGLTPFGIDDLPVGIARTFTETDGRRGRIVFISPTRADLVDDAHYLFRWADSYRRTELPDGSVVLGSGRAVIYADMWEAIISDVPPAIFASLLATIIVVMIAFRAGRPALAVIGALLVGIAWMAGLLVLLEVRLNFLNFIALPITFGLGVDYAVNIVQRYVREGAGSAVKSVRETGGAVVLCSLTTMLGYLALDGSTNYAVRSLGIAAMLGELCCIIAAVLVLPAALLFMDRRRPQGGQSFISIQPRARRK